MAAGRGAVAIDEALVTVQENATAVLMAFENHPFVFGFFHAVAKKIFETHPGAFGHGLHFPFLQPGGRVAAAVGAGLAVGFLLDRVRNILQFALDEDVPFEMHAQARVLVAFLLAEAFDLDEVGNERAFAHTSIMKYS